MKILLLGKTGLVGNAIFSVFKKDNSLITPSHAECDITKEANLTNCIKTFDPQLIINATGYTDVDAAETHKEETFQLNAKAVEFLAQISREYDIPLIHFSTDYVFDGKKKDGYVESEMPAPLGVYGASKALGEKSLITIAKKYYLIRTSWLYGPGSENFVDTVISRTSQDKELRIVDDQYGNPTYSLDLAWTLLHLLNGKNYGIYHIVNTGDTSWYAFAQEIFRQLGVPQKIIPINSRKLGRLAKRPEYSILLNTKLPQLRHWKEALADYLQNKQLIL